MAKTAARPSRTPKAAPTAFTPNADDIKKVLGPIRDARLAREALGEPVRVTAPTSSRETMKELAMKSGLDVARLEKLATKHRDELRRAAAEQRRKAVAQSKTALASLARDVATRRDLVKATQDLLPASKYQAIDRPFLIWPTLGVEFDDSHVEPFNSWAKIKYHRTSYEPTSHELTFYYLWDNDTGVDAVFSIDGFLVCNGRCEADDNGGFWVFDHPATTLTLTAQLRVYDWSTSQSNAIGGDQAQVASLYAREGSWPFSVGAIATQNVFRGFDLQAQTLLARAGHTMVFEVSLGISDFLDDGAIDVDFSSDAFQVMSPFVSITITS